MFITNIHSNKKSRTICSIFYGNFDKLLFTNKECKSFLKEFNILCHYHMIEFGYPKILEELTKISKKSYKLGIGDYININGYSKEDIRYMENFALNYFVYILSYSKNLRTLINTLARANFFNARSYKFVSPVYTLEQKEILELMVPKNERYLELYKEFFSKLGLINFVELDKDYLFIIKTKATINKTIKKISITSYDDSFIYCPSSDLRILNWDNIKNNSMMEHIIENKYCLNLIKCLIKLINSEPNLIG